MPKDYAQRFAQLIALDPDIAADYEIQLNDYPFACQVAAELEKMGILAKVDEISGLLTVQLPHDHPKEQTQSKQGKRLFGRKTPRREGDGNSAWSLHVPRLASYGT